MFICSHSYVFILFIYFIFIFPGQLLVLYFSLVAPAICYFVLLARCVVCVLVK